MKIPIIIQELLNKKAAEDDTIDLNAYALGLTDMYHRLQTGMSTIRDGTKVRVIEELNGHGFNIGEIVTVLRYHPENKYCVCIGSRSSQDWALTEDEFELVTE